MKVPHRLTIVLIAKGSVNNLHRQEVVDAFREVGVTAQFLVREGYLHLIRRMPSCEYLTCRFVEETGRGRYWRDVFRYVRSLYMMPQLHLLSRLGRRTRRQRLLRGLARGLSRSRLALRVMLSEEARLYRDSMVEGLDPRAMDQLLLQGIGGRDAHHEAVLTWWARQQGIPTIHMVGNYDHLSSKGYRGVPVEHLLVWGPAMLHDAVDLQDIPAERIRMIGAIRYDTVLARGFEDRATFLNRVGLDPAKRTILFAGPQSEHAYFEMLQAFEELQGRDASYQLILRIYPDKALMASPYTKPLLDHARRRPDVYVSMGDPHHEVPGREAELPEIEQVDLWHILRHADVVVNVYSTISLEACLVDKPVVYLDYHPTHNHSWMQPPVYLDNSVLLHNHRMMGYGATTRARDRRELLQCIEEAVAAPGLRKLERALVVQQELGPLDGRASHRVAEACIDAFRRDTGRAG